jgi:hypothetical protein
MNGMKNEKVTDLTPEQMLEMVGDPLKLAHILYILADLDNLEELIKEHGEQTIFELACDVTKDAFGGVK